MANYSIFFFLPIVTGIVAWLLAMLGFNLFLKRLYMQRKQLAGRFVQSITVDLFNAASISEKLADPTRLAAVKPIIETHVNTFLNIKLQEKLPVIAMFASPDMIAKIKEGLLEEIDLLLPEVIGQYANGALAQVDPVAAISRKVASMPKDQAKAVILQLVGKGRIRIGLFAALFGFLTGLAAVLLTLL